jgi:hypothetical protein
MLSEEKLGILEKTRSADVQELVAEVRSLRVKVDTCPGCRGEEAERARIVAWLRSYDDAHRRSALAERIEKGEHVSAGPAAP